MIVYGTFHVFVHMLMRDGRLTQRILCTIRISIFGTFSAGKKCALYTGKYGTQQPVIWDEISMSQTQIEIIFLSK